MHGFPASELDYKMVNAHVHNILTSHFMDMNMTPHLLHPQPLISDILFCKIYTQVPDPLSNVIIFNMTSRK